MVSNEERTIPQPREMDGGREMIEKEPKTFEDLWLMRETSKEWFDGQLRYKNVRNGADPEVGMVADISWSVDVSPSNVRILKKTYVISDVKPMGRSFSCRVESETVAKYSSMDDFRASEWWDLTMEKLDGGDADASWLRTVNIDGDTVEIEPAWIGYGTSFTVSMEVGSRFRDWLGNNRQGNGHKTLEMKVDRMSGELFLQCDGHTVEGTVEEIEAAMRLADRLKSLGVEIGDESITVPLGKGDDER